MAIDPDLTVSGLQTVSAIDAVFLFWENGVDGCLTYTGRNVVEVWRATSNDRTQATKIADAEGNSYLDNGFAQKQAFYYWVRARNTSGGVGPWEPTDPNSGVEASPTASNNELFTQPPGNVSNLTSTNKVDSVELSWNLPGNPIRETEVFWVESGNSRPNTPQRTASASSISIGSLTNGTQYDFWVRSSNGENLKGSVVGPVSGTPQTPNTTTDWQVDLLNIPDRFKDNAQIGVNVTDNFIGYYDGNAFQVFIRDNGDFQFRGDSNNFINWDGSVLGIQGTIVVQNPVGVRNDLNVEDGADPTVGNETFSSSDAGDLATQNSVDYSTQLLNIPDRLTDVAAIGLNITPDFLGYFNGSSFTAFIDNSGNFQFEGDSSNFISWNGSSLDIRGSLNADDINAGQLDASRVTVANELEIGNPPVTIGFGELAVETTIILGGPSTIAGGQGALSMEGDLQVEGTSRHEGVFQHTGSSFSSSTTGEFPNLEISGEIVMDNRITDTSATQPFRGGTLFFDSFDGDLKVKFSNGTIVTIAQDN